MILSELIPFLKSLDARPKKSLSQNFLVDPNIVAKIIHAAEIKPGDAILEIGPGPGALTSALLEAGARVIAVEKDAAFASALHRLQTPDQRLSVFAEDFLDFPLGKLTAPLKVVANLPYHITTPILEKICQSHKLFSSLIIMIQKEVADRIAASPGTKAFSSFTLFLQFYTQAKKPFKVGAGCFYPRPKVDSSVVRLDFHEPPLAEPAGFFSLVRQAFQKRRKMISTSLQPAFDGEKVRRCLSEIGLNPEARPETLSLVQWLELYRVLGREALKGTSSLDPTRG